MVHQVHTATLRLLLSKQAVSTPFVLQTSQTVSAVCTLLCTFEPYS